MGAGGNAPVYAEDVIGFADAAIAAVVVNALTFVLPEGRLGAGATNKSPSVNTVNIALEGKASAVHEHSISDIVDFSDAAQAVDKVITLYCDVSATVGSLVFQDGTLSEKVTVATSNTDIRPIIGIIKSKPSPAVAKVLLIGVAGGFSGLVKGKNVFISNSGLVTSARPTTGYIQKLGVALSESTVLFIPSTQRVKLI